MSIGVGTIVKVGKVAIEVDVVGIVSSGAINAVVAPMIGAVGVGAGEDEEVHTVQDIGDAFLVAGAELVDETQHEDHAGHFVAVHRRGIEEFGLAVGFAATKAGAHHLAATGKCAELKVGATVRVVGGELLHHGFIFTVGEVRIPIISSTSSVVHDRLLPHRRRSHQSGLVASLDKVVEFTLVGVCDDGLAIGAVNGAKVADGLDFGGFLSGQTKIILPTVLHQLLKVILAFLSENAAVNDDGER